MSVEALKKDVGYAAVDRYVRSGMVVGLGTGSTAKHAVDRLAQRLANGELTDIVAIPTSSATETQARELGIPLAVLDTHPIVDVAIDGADEVDSKLNLVKGRGAALLREKLVECRAKEFICVVDDSKLMWRKSDDGLGHDGAMPVEVVQFCAEHIRKKISDLPAVRSSDFVRAEFRQKNGERLVTDNGNFIIDLFFSRPIADVHALARELDDTVGVVEHGLFLDMATVCLVASPTGVETLMK